MNNYILRINKFNIYSIVLSPVLFLIAWLLILLAGPNSKFLLIFFLTSFLPIIIWTRYLRRPVEIEVNGSKIKFKDIFKKEIELSFSEITKIEIKQSKELIIQTNQIKIVGVNAFTDFSRFLSDAKRSNQNLLTIGC